MTKTNLQTPSPSASRSITQRILQGLRPLVILAFVLVGVVGALIVQQNDRRATLIAQDVSLRELQSIVASEIQPVTQALVAVSEDETTRRFAQLVDNGETNSEVFSDTQAALIRQMREFIAAGEGERLTVLYESEAGIYARVDWEPDNQADNTTFDTSFRLRSADADVNPYVSAGLDITSSQVLFVDLEVNSAQERRVLHVVASVVHPVNGLPLGILHLEMDATNLLNTVRTAPQTLTNSAAGSTHYILVDRNQRVIVDSRERLTDSLSQWVLDANRYRPEPTRLGLGAIKSEQLLLGGGGSGISWRVVLTTDANVNLSWIAIIFMIGSVLVGWGVAGVIGVFVDRNLRPINHISSVMDQLATDVLPATAVAIPTEMVTTVRQNDTDAQMLASAERIAKQIEQANTRLDVQTREFSRNLAVAARIGRETAYLDNIDDLLTRSINMIAESFGLYHAQVFLVDDARINAVLVYSLGEAGRRMLEQRHKLPIGSESVIGQVTKSGRSMIVNDTQQVRGDEAHAFNPLLPDTRAEMAIPLVIGGMVIGALDLQSDQPDVFREKDQQIYQLLADQIAVAVYKTRLIRQTESRMRTIETMNRQLTQQAWDELEREVGLDRTYRYNLLSVETGDQAGTDPDLHNTQQMFSVPIVIRGEPVGVINAAPPEGASFTEGDRLILETVAARVAIAVENARLFQKTQSNLQETFTLYETTQRLNQADSIEEVIEAVVKSAMPGAIAGQITLFDEYFADEQPEWLEVIAGWVTEGYMGTITPSELMGQRFYMPDHPLLSGMSHNQITLVKDTRRDHRLDPEITGILRRIAAGAVVFVPLKVRGVWRGMMIVEFPQPRTFSDREGRVFNNLMDQVGIAIENRQLLRQTEYERLRNERLYAGSRTINQAQSLSDLVRAAVATADDSALNFGLGIFEGELDETGWSLLVRHVAQSRNGGTYEPNRVYPVDIDLDSPMRRRKPQDIQNLDPNDPDRSVFEEIIYSNRDRYAVIFPLFSANQPIGLFFVSAKNAFDLSDDDYEAYQALTGAMSTVIQNRHLLERTEKALDETRRLYEASRAITDAADTDSMYRAVSLHLSQAASTLSRISVLRTRPQATADAPYLDCEFSWAVNEQMGNVIAVGKRYEASLVSFSKLVPRPTDIRYYPEFEDSFSDYYPGIAAFFNENDTQSVIIGSLATRQKWMGVLLIESRDENAFDEQYERFVQAVADQITITLENQLLFDEARQEAKQAIALAEASQLASQVGGDFTESINTLIARVSETAGYDRWLLVRLNQITNELELITQHTPPGQPKTISGNIHLGTAEHSIADTIRFNRTMIVNVPEEYVAYRDKPAMARAVGKHIAAPIVASDRVIGALMVGRSITEADLGDRDETVITTLAAQVAVAEENRRLFRAVETERQTLRSIINSLPAGIVVLDANTMVPVEYNLQIGRYLGKSFDPSQPFTAETYNLYRTGTYLYYPDDELPTIVAQNTGQAHFSDDVSVIDTDGNQIDMLVNAAPIIGDDDGIEYIVAAFEDISNLRSLEATLQGNLRETISLYEATRSLSEADELEDVLEVLSFQLVMIEPENVHIILQTDESDRYVGYSMATPISIGDVPSVILDNSRTLMLDDVLADASLTLDEQNLLSQNAIRALATIPLRARRRDYPIGWILITHSQPHEFTPEEDRFLSTLADNAAVAIDNRYLFLRTQSSLDETVALFDTNSRISRAHDSEELAAAIHVALKDLNPDVHAGYLMTDPSAPDQLRELFNVQPEDMNLDFAPLLIKHGLFKDENIFISDLDALNTPTPFEADLIALRQIKAFGSVSLRVRGNPDGRMFLAYTEPHRFSDADKRIIQTIADSASVVIDNTILVQQIQSSLEETSTLYQATRSLADANTVQDILNVVVERVIGTYVDQVFIAMLSSSGWDAPGATVQVVSSWQRRIGIDLQGITLTAEQFPAWNLLATQNVLMIDDVDRNRALDDLERVGIQSLETKSLAVIPLRTNKRSIGAIWIGSRESHRHTDQEVRTFGAFSEQASLSLEASYLLEQSQKRSDQLATSFQVAQIAGTILEQDAMLPQVVALIKERFGYDHVQVFLMDRENEYAMLQASTGEAGQQLLSIGHKLARGSQSVIGQVTEISEPVIALDTSDADVIHRPNPYLPLTRSEMAIPIMLKGKTVGALDVQSNYPNAFDDDDIAVLTTLAAQLAIAIENARLFDQTERRAEEMSFLFTVTTAAAAATSMEDALVNVVDLLRGSLDSSAIAIYLTNTVDPDSEDTIPTSLQLAAQSGIEAQPEDFERISLDDDSNMFTVVIKNLIPTIVDVDHEPRYRALMEGTRSAVVVPLNTGGEVFGLVALESELRYAFDQDSLTLMLTMSGALSAIIQNARLLEQVSRSNDELKALDRLKSDFLANMSHELRTPLNSIIGFSRVMLKGIDGPLTETQEQDLTTIYNSGQHLLGLINDILDQAKIAAEKMDLEKNYFELKNVVEGVKSIGIGLVKEKPVDIFVEMANNLPQAYGDEFRTRQVLLNLVSNAAKFTSEGTITLSVYPVEDEYGETMLRVDVADTGVGIAEEDLPLLFEAFRQVDSSLTRTAEGTGLGLPIARSLVLLQGGEMTVRSEVGLGSTFSITIPIQPTADDEAEADDEADIDETRPTPDLGYKKDDTQPVKAAAPNGNENGSVETTTLTVKEEGDKRTKLAGPPPGMFQQKRLVLLIEDEPNMVDQFRKTLQREGFEVFVATIQLEAEAMAGGLRPTLIIMDVNFSGGVGWDILANIKDRDDTFDIPVIVVTLSDESERAYQLGAYQVIQRPYMPNALNDAVLAAEQESNVDRILLIDDQPEDTRLLEQLLLEHGRYRVFAAHTGVDGISLVARRRPDLIILDLRMPGMDGFTVLDELRAHPESANIPVVVVTGETTLSEDEREKLVNLEIVYKTDLNQDNYQHFIDEVQRQIAKYNGER